MKESSSNKIFSKKIFNNVFEKEEYIYDLNKQES